MGGGGVGGGGMLSEDQRQTKLPGRDGVGCQSRRVVGLPDGSSSGGKSVVGVCRLPVKDVGEHTNNNSLVNVFLHLCTCTHTCTCTRLA